MPCSPVTFATASCSSRMQLGRYFKPGSYRFEKRLVDFDFLDELNAHAHFQVLQQCVQSLSVYEVNRRCAVPGRPAQAS